MSKRKNVYEMITNTIIEKLENGVVPWQQPYTTGGLPVNWLTQKQYRGINMMLLPPGEYATFKQIQKAGGKVKKGEKGRPIIFWKWLKVEDEDTGEDKKVPLLKTYNVFEINSQVEGLESKKDWTEYENDPIEEAKMVIQEYFKNQDDLRMVRQPGIPCYSPSEDRIYMPRIEHFTSSENYYKTYFHEMVHSTGHKSRLNREGVTGVINFGNENYSKEELVAEIGAAMLSAHVNIQDAVIDNSASYIDNWLSVLKNDHKFVVQAAQKAQKATDLILNIEQD